MQQRILFIKANLDLGNTEIAKSLKTTHHNVEAIMKRHEIKRPSKIIAKLKSEAGKKGAKAMRKKYKFDGEDNPNWKGGVSNDYYRYKKIQRERYPEKISAREKVHNAVKNGKLIRKPCRICGNKQSFAHHKDYARPLEVEWYCRKHHREQHNNKH